ncbi:MAG: hypothetical protein IT158_06270 [Bryobacterales bacterium]|nr:hypothetical protein [Bryobacterales bacterium]
MVRVVLLLLAALAPLRGQSPSQACSFCHLKIYLDCQRTGHEKHRVACQGCHGQSTGHRNAEDNSVKPDRLFTPAASPGLCMGCHPGVPFKNRPHAAALARGRGPGCTTCHGAHGLFPLARRERACLHCHSPLPEDCRPAGCGSCHDPHSLSPRRRSEP